MIIKAVKLQNFRCHKVYELNCNKKTSLIVGENGCGKTSILEAIYLGLRGKSFRAVDREIVQRSEKFYRVEIDFVSGEKTVVFFENGKRVFVVQGKKFGRLPMKNRYPVVLFEPDDLNLVGASPSKKRDYFDRIFSQLDAKYSNSLSKYNKTLKQRNELLKSDFVRQEALFSWNVLLAKYGVEIIKERTKYIDRINQNFTEVYRSIADNLDEVLIEYKGDILSESEYLKNLENNFERDKAVKHTSFGVHRDDYGFLFNLNTADGSASRGEVRSMVLALKFIEAEMIFEILKQKPLVLFDDVFSELDEKRQKSLVTNFRDNQVIITSVDEI